MIVVLIKPSPNLFFFFGIRCTDESFKTKNHECVKYDLFDFMLTLTMRLYSGEHVSLSLSSLKLYKLLTVSVKI